MFFTRQKTRMPTEAEALPGRDTPMPVPARHAVLDAPLSPPFPDGMETALFAMGCFWGAEKLFWETDGVYTTAVGYAGGLTPNPTYEEVCSGLTGHAEVALVVFDPAKVSYEELLRVFWEHHDPTQGMRQGNDVGTQYRSAIWTSSQAQRKSAEASRDAYQQYLHENPAGYCPDHSTGVSCPVGLFASSGTPPAQAEQAPSSAAPPAAVGQANPWGSAGRTATRRRGRSAASGRSARRGSARRRHCASRR